MGSDYCGTRVILIPSVTYTAGFLYSPFSVKRESVSHSIQLFLTPQTVATRLLCPWNFPGKNTGVGIPFSRGSSQPRNQTCVSRTAAGFFTVWTTRGALQCTYHILSFVFSWAFKKTHSLLDCKFQKNKHFICFATAVSVVPGMGSVDSKYIINISWWMGKWMSECLVKALLSLVLSLVA